MEKQYFEATESELKRENTETASGIEDEIIKLIP